jgi:hypothetical protein
MLVLRQDAMDAVTDVGARTDPAAGAHDLVVARGEVLETGVIRLPRTQIGHE